MCRCFLCQTSGWWCWTSPSPTCPLTLFTLRRTAMTLMLPSCWSPFQTRCHTPAPGSQSRSEICWELVSEVVTHFPLIICLIVSFQMRCQANQNGSQIECDLGNPVKRNTKVNCVTAAFISTLHLFHLTRVVSTAEILHQPEHSEHHHRDHRADGRALPEDVRVLTCSTVTVYLRSLALIWAHYCFIIHCFSISEQPDLLPLTAYAKVVIELPLSVSGWVTPSASLCCSSATSKHGWWLFTLFNISCTLSASSSLTLGEDLNRTSCFCVSHHNKLKYTDQQWPSLEVWCLTDLILKGFSLNSYFFALRCSLAQQQRQISHYML